MTCIHGLDEINCPMCSMMRSTMPLKKLHEKKENFLKIENPFFKKNLMSKDNLVNELTNKRLNLNLAPLNIIPKPNLINRIPKFENRLFLEKLKELDLDKGDILGIPKKIPIENPEWKFEEED